MDKIAFVIMGQRHSGKSTTWYELFGKKVNKGWKKLFFNLHDFAWTYVLSASSEEKGVLLRNRLGKEHPQILLCSIQYTQKGYDSFNFLIEEGYTIRCIWLNPGFKDDNSKPLFDHLGIIPYLLSHEVTLAIRNGKGRTKNRVAEIREHIYGWTGSKKLIYSTS